MGAHDRDRRGAALALDVGGANLKAAHSMGGAWTAPFALWKRPRALAGELGALASRAPAFDRLLVTMTAELCDCFPTRRDGVFHVLGAAEALAGGRPVHVWTTDGEFVHPATARAAPLRAAAANWLALATYAARLVADRGPALLIDVGSTTTDLVYLEDGRPRPRSRTDTERLASGELVYSGARRTPLMALGPSVAFRGAPFPLMAELFATTADAHLFPPLERPEEPGCTDTADGRPLTRSCAAARLLRMIGADLETMTTDDAAALAAAFARAQQERILAAARLVIDGRPLAVAVTAGSGGFIADAVARDLGAANLSLAELIGQDASTAACAYALLRIEAHS